MIEVRLAATHEERDAAMQVRFRVFVEEQKVPPELEPDEYDASALHWIAVAEGSTKVVGTARLVEKADGIAKIGRVAVLPEWRGKRIGEALMRAALKHAASVGYRRAILDAQVPVIAFYEGLGFVAEGPVFDDAGIPHRHMTRPLGEED